MIEVKHLTKRYGSHVAVSDLSFRIEKGVIYGFLGPNGAGKSTTMNIITGCLGATEGEVLVDGHSISEEPMAAKKRIGYLPEQPPLYTDMTPMEYLRFVAEVKGLSRTEQNEQIDHVIDKAGIREVRDRLIRNLSKGYRQRVGIAQALLGDPEVIILDEPTVGLDPAQIIGIRELIREMGKDHTIILSSHILSEVQTVCDSIMILSNGKLVACDTPDHLTGLFSGTTTLHLETKASEETVEHVLTTVECIEDMTVRRREDGVTVIDIKPEEGAEIREDLFLAFAEAKAPLLEMKQVQASLEDVFLELTNGDPQFFMSAGSAFDAGEAGAADPTVIPGEASGEDGGEET